MIVLDYSYQGRRKRIRADRESLSIGRDKSCAIRIPEDGIGDRHCTIRAEQVKRTSGKRGKKTVIRLEDHQCADVPTLVNGFEVIKTQLNPGDVIQIGGLRLVVGDRNGLAVPTSEPAATDSAPTRERLATPVAVAPEDDFDDVAPLPARPVTTRGPATRSQRSPLAWLGTGVAAAAIIVAILVVVKQGNTDKPTRGDRTRTSSELAKLRGELPADRGAANRSVDARNAISGRATTVGDPGANTGKADPASGRKPASGSTGGKSAGSGATANEPPAADLLTKRDIYLEALKADRLSQAHDFAEAASRYQTLARSTTEKRLQDEMKDRLTDLRTLANARRKIETRIMETVKSGGPLPTIVNRGVASKVLGIDDDGVPIVELAGGQAKLPWDKVAVKAMTTLLGWAHPEGEGDLLRGLYLFELKDRFNRDPELARTCHAAINRALQLAPSRKAEIDGVLRRALGVTSKKGFVYHNGRFMTEERRDRLVHVKASREQLANLESARPETRQAAYTYLRSVKDLEVYQLFRKVLEARRLGIGRELLASSTGKKLVELRREKEKFLAIRKQALARIFDTRAYPYPYRVSRGASQEDYQKYLESQKMIDGWTKQLRKSWNGTRGSFTLGPNFLRRYNELREVIAELAKFPKDEVPPAEVIAPLTALGDPTFFVERYRGKVTLATLPMDAKERQLLGYSARVMDHNRQLQSEASKTERQQVLVTNEYRLMMGSRAVMLNPNLLEAARGHSRDMVLKGYFAHEAPDPERRTPRLRVLLAGYKGECSENICRGTSSPVKAHDRWIHSSGHHRNLLRPHWYELGSGNVGSYWTQNFGSRGKSLDKLQAEAKSSSVER